jgi:hypothetical protein
MRRRPGTHLLLLAATLLASGCVGSSTRDAAPSATDPEPPVTASDAPQPATGADDPACPQPPAPVDVDLDPVLARRLLDAATHRATRTPGAFITDLQVRLDGELLGRGRLDGTRTPASSSGELRWSGGAALLLPDMALRIERDRLLVRTERDQDVRDFGSASGVALDVGRELLNHPQLLDEHRARGTRTRFAVDLTAPAQRLRDYATSERQGPVTELLRGVRSLRLTARVAGGRLAGDSFSLQTDVPLGIDELGALAGRTVTVAGQTRHC